MHCLRQKSQHLRLLFIEQYMNSNRVLPKRVKKKKKKITTQNAAAGEKRGSKHTLKVRTTKCGEILGIRTPLYINIYCIYIYIYIYIILGP